MSHSDFSDIASPWLSSLEDDPKRGPPQAVSSTLPEELGVAGAKIDEWSTISTDSPTLFESNIASELDVSVARKALRQLGIDVLAFYKSFRFKQQRPFPDTWGIYILDTGVATVAAEYAAAEREIPQNELVNLAVATLVSHERYHFWVDAWALGYEILPMAKQTKRYEYYLANRCALASGFDCEESLANHYAFRLLSRRKLSDGTSAERLVGALFDACPAPYSDFRFGSHERTLQEAALARAVANGENSSLPYNLLRANGRNGISGVCIRPPNASHPLVGHRNCPIHNLRVKGFSVKLQPFQGPPLKELRRFIENYLAGTMVGHTDHDYYRIDNGEKVRFPNPHDKNAKARELDNILMKAGMTSNLFNRERLRTRFWNDQCPRQQAIPARAS